MRNITILDKEYPIEYTVEAQAKVAEKAGDLKKVSEVIDRYPCFIISVMMSAAYHRNQVFARLDGKEYEGAQPLGEDELNAILMPHELKPIMLTVVEVMNEAFKTDVETAPDKSVKQKKSTPLK